MSRRSTRGPIALKRLTKRQVMVYRLLRGLNGRASTLEIIRLAKERHPQSNLYARVRDQLDKLEAKGYVSRDKSRLPYVWVITKKLEVDRGKRAG